MKILFVSNLYPNRVSPGTAPYNRQLMVALAKSAEVRVMAPFAWFPGQQRLRGRLLPPREETIDNIQVTHPRCFYTPGMLIHHHWRLYRASVACHMRRVLAAFAPDHVIAGFLYPDGAAVLSLCRGWGIPCAVRVNGSDFRLRITQPRFREIVLDTLRSASTVFCPGQALRRDIMAAATDASKVFAFDNGVDHAVFKMRDRDLALHRIAEECGCMGIWESGSAEGGPAEDGANTQAPHSDQSSHGLRSTAYALRSQITQAITRLHCGARCVLCVGHLRQVKGPDRLVRAFCALARQGGAEDTVLVMVGHGDMTTRLKHEVEKDGMGDRVFFVGNRTHREVALWMNVADCLCLPSRSEGMPNVVVEALASGLPVVATAVGEVPFLISDSMNGFVCDGNGGTDTDVERALARGIAGALCQSWDHAAISESVAHMTWARAADVVLTGLMNTTRNQPG